VSLWRGVPCEYSRTANGLVFTAGACPLDADGNVVSPGDRETQAAVAADSYPEQLVEIEAVAGFTRSEQSLV